MARAFRTAAIIVGGAALIATGIGAAAAIGALGTVAAGSSTAAFLASAATVAKVAGFAAAALTLAGTAATPKGTVGGNPTKFKIDKDAGIPLIIGRTLSGGNVVHRQFYDDPRSKMRNQRESWVAVHSLGPVKSIGPLLVDKAPVSFDAGGQALGSYRGNMWLDTQLGACPELRALRGPTGDFPGWNAASKLSGLAADLWTLDYDSKGVKYPNGVPDRARVIEGFLWWDPRLDSTYPGGMGLCRRDDPLTHVYSECPWIVALNFALGLFQNGFLVAGGGMKLTGVDVNSFVQAANVADANGWKAGGIIYTMTDNDWDSLKMMAQAGGGELQTIAGTLSCTWSAPRVSIATITSADIIGDVDAPSTASARKRRNTIIPKVRLESQGWEVVPLAPVTVPAYAILDGAPRPREIVYPLVQQATQGAQLAMYDMLNSRELEPIVLPCRIDALGFLPGDCVTVDIPEANLVGRPVVLRTRELDGSTFGVTFTARSEDVDKHAFALGKTGIPPRTPDLSIIGPDLSAPAASDWMTVGGTLSANGMSVPALLVTGAAPQGAIEALVFEYRVQQAGQDAEAGWIGSGLDSVQTTRKEITGVTSGTSYEVSLRYRVRGVVGDRLISDAVIAGDAALPWEKISDPDGKKPDDNADVTGENTAKDTNAIGGRPTPVVLEKVDKIEPMLEDLAATKGVTEAQGRALDALRIESNSAFDLLGQDVLEKADALRSIDDELQRLGHIALSSLLDHEETRRIMRDAGVSVDPASGTATIWAIEQLKDQTRKVELTIDAQAAEIRQKVTVDRVEEMILLAQLDPGQIAELEPLIRRVTTVEQVASGLLASISAKAEAAELTRTTARLTTVSQTLDALSGTVDSKASRLDVDAQGVRLTQIGQQLAAMPDGARLSVELTQVRTEAAAGQLATLDALLAGEAAADRRIAEMAQYRQEVITRIDAGLAVEVAERRSLAATMGGIDVRLSAELRGLVTATGGTARQVAALEVASQQQTAQIGDLREASIDAKGGIAGLQTTVRQMGPRADAAELAALDGMLDAEERGVDAQRQLSQVQQEMTTRFVAGERSAAATKLLLEARIGGNDARIGQTAEAVAELGRSTATRMDAIDVRVGRLSDDTAASQVIVTRELSALAEADRAIGRDIATLSAELRDPATGLSKTRAELLREIEISADDREALARAYTGLAAIVDDPATGLARTRSQLMDEIELSGSDRAALARQYEALQAIVMDPSGTPYWVGSIADLRRVVIDGDELLAERVDTVQGTVGDNTASIQFLRRVVDGKEAIAQLAVDVNSKVTGFRIDGQDRTFAIAADRFIVGDSQIFEIDATTGETRMKSAAIGAATIDTLNLKDGSITAQTVGTPPPMTVAMAGAGTGTRTTDSGMTEIVTTGRRVRIDVQMFTRTEVEARWSATITLMRQTAAGTVQIGRAMPIGTADLTLGWWEVDQPAAGAVRYFLRAALEKTSSGLAQVDFSSIQIAIEETKK